MSNISMKIEELADGDLESVSAAGTYGGVITAAVAGAVVSGWVGGGVVGAIASAVTGIAVGDTGSHLEDKVNER